LPCGGLLVLLRVGGEQHLPLLVHWRLPVQVGARLKQYADIGLLMMVLLLPLMPLLHWWRCGC
jgi:hypothetical protein